MVKSKNSTTRNYIKFQWYSGGLKWQRLFKEQAQNCIVQAVPTALYTKYYLNKIKLYLHEGYTTPNRNNNMLIVQFYKIRR